MAKKVRTKKSTVPRGVKSARSRHFFRILKDWCMTHRRRNIYITV